MVVEGRYAQMYSSAILPSRHLATVLDQVKDAPRLNGLRRLEKGMNEQWDVLVPNNLRIALARVSKKSVPEQTVTGVLI